MLGLFFMIFLCFMWFYVVLETKSSAFLVQAREACYRLNIYIPSPGLLLFD